MTVCGVLVFVVSEREVSVFLLSVVLVCVVGGVMSGGGR